MTNAITISGSTYTVTGTVKDKNTNQGILDLHVFVNDFDVFNEDDFLGIGVTDKDGRFCVSFDASQFGNYFDRSPDLYFVVQDAGLELLDTKDDVITDANTSTPDINLLVDISNDELRKEINKDAAPGWVGGFSESNQSFAYPDPDLSSLKMLDNMENIDKLQRQQKVLWPEFSWNTAPGEADSKRCYQMFAPDISRLGYTNEGRVYSIICPQQGITVRGLGTMNVEVTVTGNRGWAHEAEQCSERELAAGMSVVGKIWFSPSAREGKYVKQLGAEFDKHDLPFPWDKARAIVVKTHIPGDPEEPIFPLRQGESTDFPIPDFARHQKIAWNVGHLGVQIGAIETTGNELVDKFNQFVLGVFNVGSGNMLKRGNILTWNVWFTAPGLVDEDEWRGHAEKWRESIQADHGSPEGPGTKARYFDGTPFNPLESAAETRLPGILAHLAKNLAS
ncbi:MAG: hypothetical protein KUG79_08145 [Pseudomonadales bacterium]|nr:hypothetical protein [Pseudomonadales bacterium]